MADITINIERLELHTQSVNLPEPNLGADALAKVPALATQSVPGPASEGAANESANLLGSAREPEPVSSDTGPEPIDNGTVLRFLGDPRFALRSQDALEKHFGVPEFSFLREALEDVLDDLQDEGLVHTKTRRADGATLYGLTPLGRSELQRNAQDEVPAGGWPEVTGHDIRDFLRSDVRYEWRTEGAILKFFQNEGCAASRINDAIYQATQLDLIEGGQRRTDGAVIFRAR